MASQVEIVNRALLKLGSDTITSLTEAAPGARAMAASWNSIREDELSRYPWIFAKTQSQLAASTSDPAYRWNYKYRRASDDLRIIEIGEDQVWADWGAGRVYDLLGRDVVTDYAAPLNVTYVRNVTNAGEFSASFSEALAARLAAEHCLKVTGSTSLLPVMEGWYDKAVARAKRNNAIQLPPRQIGGSEPWLGGRIGYKGIDRGGWWRT